MVMVGQFEPETRAGSWWAAEADLTAEFFDNATDDGESESVAVGSILGKLGERHKYVRMVGGADPEALVLDPKSG
jgi:hypothetical protein